MKDRSISRRQALSAFGLFSSATLAGMVGAQTVFTDSDSQRQAIRTGALTLELGEADTAVFNLRNFAPTRSVQDAVTLRNGGTIPGTLDIRVSYAETDASHPVDNTTDRTGTELAEHLTVSRLAYGGNSLLDHVGTEADGDSTDLTLADLAADGTADSPGLSDLSDPGSGRDFELGFTYQNVGNTYQNDGLVVTLTFVLTQATDRSVEEGT